MITMQDYFMGRDNTHPLEMTTEIERNAEILVPLANALLSRFGQWRKVNSGWRPPSLNAQTTGAAKFSRHMTGQAIDLEDHDGMLDDWISADPGLSVLQELGLWAEHQSATKGWCHLQSVPPRSGRRIFYP